MTLNRTSNGKESELQIAEMFEELSEGWEYDYEEGAFAYDKDPGLYPRYTYFHATTNDIRYLRHIPGFTNVLMSAHNVVGKQDLTRARDLDKARMMFLDSGAITPLVKVMNGKGSVEALREWLTRSEDLVTAAWMLFDLGCKRGIVGTMDLPQYGAALEASGISREEAMSITIENSVTFQDELMNELPPGWKPCFMIQGTTVDDYVNCTRAYIDLGIVDLAREHEAWLGVGSTLNTNPPALYSIYRHIREEVGDRPHIHALGVARIKELVHMARRGWINGSDSASTFLQVGYNQGPYATKGSGPRGGFVREALLAGTAMVVDTELIRALEKADSEPVFEQEELL